METEEKETEEKETEESERTVTVKVGAPAEFGMSPGMPHPSECYMVDFSAGDHGVTAVGTCLCKLGEATKAWLNGESTKRIKRLMGHKH